MKKLLLCIMSLAFLSMFMPTTTPYAQSDCLETGYQVEVMDYSVIQVSPDILNNSIEHVVNAGQLKTESNTVLSISNVRTHDYDVSGTEGEKATTEISQHCPANFIETQFNMTAEAARTNKDPRLSVYARTTGFS